ncbi:Parkinson disease 7 domain-containing protein 1 [Armadillidium nasatum]|uniref:Parkinson disease 7 domain-containing protein 1 n=1 Tax=Armadillidium nasatum TaxID=96803 RepID=A0A5N5TJQ8_9CRUS|nr:Parkinson disease 7 domain-containing protein 1 [Armadillidium nasatum]
MSKQVCLLVLSSSPNGVSAPSFLQCYKLIQSAFILQIATPDGAEPHFIDEDEQSTRWLADMESKKPLCTIGLGVCSLFSAKDSDDSWSFMDYSLTGSSLGELIISPIFVGMPYIPSDIIFDKGGRYCEGAPNTVHVIINRNVNL